jgi:hypothetical protein
MESINSLNVTEDSLMPTSRRLRGYAFDPSFANQLDSSGVNTITYNIRWESLGPGPVGEYVEVMDVDPASGAIYPPVDLEDARLLAQDGLPPSESNPQFHQQMVYAVTMLTIQHFEKALGRRVQWSSQDYTENKPEKFIPCLRLYPHAFRGANAYYSSQKKAVLFGYFSAYPDNKSALMPGSLVFCCLSHDIIAHEVTHALIDGVHKRLILPIHEDTLAVHEAFADIVALFQRFTFPEILENQIARTRGKLTDTTWLAQLAHQFGLAIGQYGYLRKAIAEQVDPRRLEVAKEPHERGSILVAAMFNAFISIYNQRTADLFRIATEGRGVLPEGEIHPDLVRRLAAEASRTARQFLTLFIRGLDYCPPIGTTFGDLLRAMITADVDLVMTDQLNYRVALLESFKQWGIYPEGVRNLSVENLTHLGYTENDLIELGAAVNNIAQTDTARKAKVQEAIDGLREILRNYFNKTALNQEVREELFRIAQEYKLELHEIIEGTDPAKGVSPEGKRLLQSLISILLIEDDYPEFVDRSVKAINAELNKRQAAGAKTISVSGIKIEKNKNGSRRFEIHSLNRAQRVGPEANVLNQVVLTIMQTCLVTVTGEANSYKFRGGSTLVVDMDKKLIRVINKGTMRRFYNEIDARRLAKELIRRYDADETEGESPFAPAMWASETAYAEPFALLHRQPLSANKPWPH